MTPALLAMSSTASMAMLERTRKVGWVENSQSLRRLQSPDKGESILNERVHRLQNVDAGCHPRVRFCELQ